MVKGVPGPHPHANFHRCGFKTVGLEFTAPKTAKIGNFWYIPKGYISVIP